MAAVVLLALPTTFALQDQVRDPALWSPAGSWPRWWLYVLPLCKVVPTLLLYVTALTVLFRARRDLNGN
jgi:hypothetical protein